MQRTEHSISASGRRVTLDQHTEHLNVLYFGEPGSGKTTASAHLVKIGRVLYIDAERGIKRRPLEVLGLPVERIELHTDISFTALVTLVEEIKADLARDPESWAGVVVDSISEVQRDDLERSAAGRHRLSKADYGEDTQKMRWLVRHFRDLHCHVAITAHARRDEDDDGEVHIGPSVTPALASDVLGFVDIVCYARTHHLPNDDEPTYVGSFRPGSKFVAKDRLGVLPPRLVSPTFDRILDYAAGRFTREALRAAELGDIRDDLDPLQHAYIKHITSSATTSSKGAQQ